jgi:hypothetical protein
MKKIYIAIAVLCSLSLTPLAQGGTTTRAKVQYILSTQTGWVSFLTGSVNGAAACNTSGEWAINLTGPNAVGSKVILASLLAAQAQGKDIFVAGTGTCDIWGDRETVAYILVYT